MVNNAFEQKNTELGRRCLALIRDIADRGASSWDPEQVGYALQELSQVLFERLGCEDRMFPAVSAGQLTDLAHLYDELLWVDGFSRDMFRPQ
jgi:hypothetical protein